MDQDLPIQDYTKSYPHIPDRISKWLDLFHYTYYRFLGEFRAARTYQHVKTKVQWYDLCELNQNSMCILALSIFRPWPASAKLRI